MTDWTTPVTPNIGDPVGPTFWNPQVRDNFLHLKENQGALGGLSSGLQLGTHVDSDIAAKTIQLRRAERIVFDTGQAVANLTPKTADITLAGADGLDTGTEQASAWYEIHAIYNPSSGLTSLVLHRARSWLLDETYDSDDTNIGIRAATGTRTAVGQGFKVDNTGYVDFVDVELIRVGAPSGTLYAELQTDTAGLPSGTVIATSDKLAAGNVSTASQWVRFIFRTPVSLTAATQYHLALTGSWTASDTVYVGWRCDTSAATYANGSRTQKDGGTWNNTGLTTHDFSFKIYVRQNDATVTMPSGYEGKCLIGYVFNDSSSNFAQFAAIDKAVIPISGPDGNTDVWLGATGSTPQLHTLEKFVPPIPLRCRLSVDTGGAGATFIAGVPYGFKSPSYIRDAGSSWTAAGQSFQYLMIATETQAFYGMDNLGGGFDITFDSYEW